MKMSKRWFITLQNSFPHPSFSFLFLFSILVDVLVQHFHHLLFLGQSQVGLSDHSCSAQTGTVEEGVKSVKKLKNKFWKPRRKEFPNLHINSKPHWCDLLCLNCTPVAFTREHIKKWNAYILMDSDHKAKTECSLPPLFKFTEHRAIQSAWKHLISAENGNLKLRWKGLCPWI